MQAVHHDNPVLSLADTFKALGDPMRFQIVRIMQRDSFGVLELCDLFEVRQPAMSHHLKLLVEAGLLCSRREGNSLFYRRVLPGQTSPSVQMQPLFRLIDQQPVPEQLYAKLRQLQSQREQRSRDFFLRNADRFRDQQDLIAGHGEYGAAIGQMVQSLELPCSSWLEVGCGEGELLQELADHFERVAALDVSAELLQAAKERLPGAGQVDWWCRELNGSACAGEFGLVTCNMVLHHLASPAELVQEMATAVAPGGFLLLCDLCRHDQEWARSSCGDLWLGFEREELMDFADQQGMALHAEQFLALRNGFRVQLMVFRKQREEK